MFSPQIKHKKYFSVLEQYLHFSFPNVESYAEVGGNLTMLKDTPETPGVFLAYFSISIGSSVSSSNSLFIIEYSSS
jgi:hypothetical protein